MEHTKMPNRQEIFNRINFWKKQNNEPEVKIEVLDKYSDMSLITILFSIYKTFENGGS